MGRPNLGPHDLKSVASLTTVAATIVAAVNLRFGVIHFERPPVQVLPIEFFFGRASLRLRIHLHEAETLRPARVSVGYDVARFHWPHLAEQVTDFITGRLE